MTSLWHACQFFCNGYGLTSEILCGCVSFFYDDDALLFNKWHKQLEEVKRGLTQEAGKVTAQAFHKDLFCFHTEQ